MDNVDNSSAETLISVRKVNKSFGKKSVLSDINLDINKGRIFGLIGPNGAGKTTLLRALLGLSTFDGDISVLGMHPIKQRTKILEQVCFIADTAILPHWLKVSQAIDYLEQVHPQFDRAKAEELLASTSVDKQQKVSQMSKGMITQLHLALVMAINAKILVLDEPTLGLDILYRKQFYTTLLNDYFDEDRTIIITTHQVEEVESLLTDLLFVKDGKISLNCDMETLEEQYSEIEVSTDKLEAARKLHPIHERPVLGGSICLFENVDKTELAQFGATRTPSVSDLFVAKMLS